MRASRIRSPSQDFHPKEKALAVLDFRPLLTFISGLCLRSASVTRFERRRRGKRHKYARRVRSQTNKLAFLRAHVARRCAFPHRPTAARRARARRYAAARCVNADAAALASTRPEQNGRTLLLSQQCQTLQHAQSTAAETEAYAMAKVTTEKLLDDLKTVVDDAEELLRATAGHAGEKVSAARERASESVRTARKRMAEMQDDAVARTRHLAESADGYVRENPWRAVGTAAVAGLILGMLVSRR